MSKIQYVYGETDAVTGSRHSFFYRDKILVYRMRDHDHRIITERNSSGEEMTKIKKLLSRAKDKD